jgi:hypothetical protein
MAYLSAARKAELIAKARTLAEDTKRAPETLRTRKQAVISWKKFAGAAVPTEELVWLYVVQEVTRKRKKSGIAAYLSNIKGHFVAKDSGMDQSIFKSARIKEVLWQCASRMKRSGNHTKRARVVTEEQLRLVCEGAKSFDDLLFCAILVSLFFNISRGAEMVYPGHVRSQKANKLPLYGNVITCRSKTTIRMMSQKNAQFRAEDLHLHKGNTARWGREVMFEYAKARGDEANELSALPEFFVRADGSIPTTPWLNRRLKQALGEAYTLHGLRAGGATRLALLGWSAFHIQMAGRWSSDYFMTYISQYPELAAALASHNNLPQKTVRRMRI